MSACYLDVETGLDRGLTVVGVHHPGRGIRQVVRPGITRDAVLEALEDATAVVTFNGACFDLPVLRGQLGLDLKKRLKHRDLLQDCRRLGLRGGLKVVEMRLGIPRDTEGVDGLQAVMLWERWSRRGEREALDLLLRYNREDCENLETLESKLVRRYGVPPSVEAQEAS